MSNPSSSPTFVDLFTGSQLKLYRYIVVLVADQHAAEDILQNTNLVLLRKCDQFCSDMDFGAWSRGIAYIEVLKYRNSQRRANWALSDETLAALAKDANAALDALEERNRALPDCLKKLPPSDLALVTDHYFHGQSWEAIADQLGRTSSSVRHSICRIRRRLKACIDSVLRGEEIA